MEQKNAISAAMILLTVCIAQFMLTSIGVALPSLGRELKASVMQINLVEQCYTLSWPCSCCPSAA
ncbi:MAG: hypothetical protein LBD10_07115 [Desulfobulbus sp.]|uniref:hypothetical protein n=1 Tax=Desulfobulbus sp. TaxID=895 RepID=UPI00283DC5BC|nr:hypothetical protein [Desulfobulbus sp.]MDR2549950.1 hypothetical protein [Desulfobulbus sp.]